MYHPSSNSVHDKCSFEMSIELVSDEVGWFIAMVGNEKAL